LDAEVLEKLPLPRCTALQVAAKHPRVVTGEKVLIVGIDGGHRMAEYPNPQRSS